MGAIIPLMMNMRIQQSMSCMAAWPLLTVAISTDIFEVPGDDLKNHLQKFFKILVILTPCGAIGYKSFSIRRVSPFLAENPLMRRSPASEERSPPQKFIFTRLLLSRDVAFKMFIGSFF